jgi:hypothetical protein
MEEKIIMYDSPEAAKQVTVTGWVSADRRFFGDNEDMARYAGCTHKKCECGNIVKKGWVKCESCRGKDAHERFMALPFKEWDWKEVVCTTDSDKYFFSIDDLVCYMNDEFDEPLQELDLLICVGQNMSTVGEDFWADDLPDDGEVPDELKKALAALNDVVKSLPPQVYYPSKTRTKVKLSDFS